MRNKIRRFCLCSNVVGTTTDTQSRQKKKISGMARMKGEMSGIILGGIITKELINVVYGGTVVGNGKTRIRKRHGFVGFKADIAILER